MPDQMSIKLEAYLDGELDKRGQKEVEAHLEKCPSCRDELEELRKLSALMDAIPEPDFASASEFKARIMLQLPRKEETAKASSNGRNLLWLVPVAVLTILIFVQAAAGIFNLVSLANQAGPLSGVATWMNNAPQRMHWFVGSQQWIGNVLNPQSLASLQILNEIDAIKENLLIYLLCQIGAAMLYFGALFLLWRSKAKSFWTSTTSK